jgi:glycosidase
MRQLVTEYDASDAGQLTTRQKYGVNPVLSILIRCYQYVVARYDFDAMRIDTTKYLRPEIIESFGNAMRELGLTIGKKDFYTYGEIWETDDSRLENFVGRHTPDGDGLGIDAALDFPLQNVIKSIVKGNPQSGVEDLRNLFLARKKCEEGRISSHGEAGRYFVSFLDNHDMHERFNHSQTPLEQVTMALGLLFTLQGVPCVYYGTERGLTGTIDGLDAYESVREALWGMPNAFAQDGLYLVVQALARLRGQANALRYGRLYFRETSGNGSDFGLPSGPGGVVAFSRVVGNEEVSVVANTNTAASWSGSVLVDLDIAMRSTSRSVQHSNKGTTGTSSVAQIQGARFWSNGQSSLAACPTAAVHVVLAPMELQVIA